MTVKGARPDHLRVTPNLIVRDADAAVRFYREALGAVELYRAPCHNGKLHLHLKIYNSIVFLSEEDFQAKNPKPEYMGVASPETLGGSTVVLHLYLDDVDAAYKRAVDAGASPTLLPSDVAWGDRTGMVTDPFGYAWVLTTIREELTPEEIDANMREFLSSAARDLR